MICLQGYSQVKDSTTFYKNKDLVMKDVFGTSAIKWYSVDKNTFSAKDTIIGDEASNSFFLYLYDTIKETSTIKQIKCNILFIQRGSNFTDYGPEIIYFNLYKNNIRIDTQFYTEFVNHPSGKRFHPYEVDSLLKSDITGYQIAKNVNVACNKGDIIKIEVVNNSNIPTFFCFKVSRFRDMKIIYEKETTSLKEEYNKSNFNVVLSNNKFITTKYIKDIKVYNISGDLLYIGTSDSIFNLQQNMLYVVIFDNIYVKKYFIN